MAPTAIGFSSSFFHQFLCRYQNREILKLSSNPILDDGNRRRKFIGIAGISLFYPFVATSLTNGPVAILGASGRTAMEVSKDMAKNGVSVVTMTRTGKDPFEIIKLGENMKQRISHYPSPVNVVSEDSLREALSKVKPSGIIFCASASKKGGTAFEVDDKGVGNAAKISKELGSRFILISALAVDRPESKSFKITNKLGGNLNGIMDAKMNGENKVRSILGGKSRDYVIIRPGVLMNGKSKIGASDLEVNQGDFIGGGLSRDELSGVVVGAFLSDKKGVTIEVYRTSTHTKLQPDFSENSGLEKYGSSYVDLFSNVKLD